MLFTTSLASYSQQTSLADRKAAIIKRWIYDNNPLVVKLSLPVAGHPLKIEEVIVNGTPEPYSSYAREYLYENDRLIKVIETKGEKILYTYQLLYDNQDRLVCIDKRTPVGSDIRDVYEYGTEKPYDITWKRYEQNQLNYVYKYAFNGSTDNASINIIDVGVERYRFRKENENIVVEKREQQTPDTRTPDMIQVYDINNVMISEKYWEHGALIWHHIIKNDKCGNELSRIINTYKYTLGNNGVETQVSRLENGATYQYDNLGNWIYRYYSSPNSNHTLKTTRKITYRD